MSVRHLGPLAHVPDRRKRPHGCSVRTSRCELKPFDCVSNVQSTLYYQIHISSSVSAAAALHGRAPNEPCASGTTKEGRAGWLA